MLTLTAFYALTVTGEPKIKVDVTLIKVTSTFLLPSLG